MGTLWQPSPWNHKRILALCFLALLLQRSWKCVPSYGHNISKSLVSMDQGGRQQIKGKIRGENSPPKVHPLSFTEHLNMLFLFQADRLLYPTIRSLTMLQTACVSFQWQAFLLCLPSRTAAALVPAPGFRRSHPALPEHSRAQRQTLCFVESSWVSIL